jgi:chemotaxis protein MotB
MSAQRGGRRRRKKSGHEDAHPDERWLLTYADMITLLMALFMVLFSISSVNKSKYETLQRTLKDAFSGRVLPGGKGLAQAGGPAESKKALAPPLATLAEPISTVNPGSVGRGASGAKGAGAAQRQAEDRQFEELKRQIDAYTREHGLQGQVRTTVSRDGLHIRLLTDKLLFDSGSASPKPAATPLLDRLGGVLHQASGHSVEVAGHTDKVPIHSAQFPSNWELSGARAAAVVRALASHGVNRRRLTAAGRADLDPITSNDTPAGRQINRRVEILLPRVAP